MDSCFLTVAQLLFYSCPPYLNWLVFLLPNLLNLKDFLLPLNYSSVLCYALFHYLWNSFKSLFGVWLHFLLTSCLFLLSSVLISLLFLLLLSLFMSFPHSFLEFLYFSFFLFFSICLSYAFNFSPFLLFLLVPSFHIHKHM